MPEQIPIQMLKRDVQSSNGLMLIILILATLKSVARNLYSRPLKCAKKTTITRL